MNKQIHHWTVSMAQQDDEHETVAVACHQPLVQNQTEYGIILVGPTRPNNNWQAKVDGAYTVNGFVVDWEKQQVPCPQGKVAPYWTKCIDRRGTLFITVDFHTRDCQPCQCGPCVRARRREHDVYDYSPRSST